MTPTVRWKIFPDASTLAAAAAEYILNTARAALKARGEFHLVLAGGSTPLATYAELARRQANTHHWKIYFGDERCLPVNDSGRNDTQSRQAWLDSASIPPENIHAIPAELGPARAAQAYAETLRGVPAFDLVLLGLGEDGHTASLFPGLFSEEASGGADVLAIKNAPKAPRERVTLSPARLSRAHQVLFLVTGKGKRHAVAAWRRGDNLPARYVVPATAVEVWIDAAAEFS
jgi:6-phosphogluconolactonase